MRRFTVIASLLMMVFAGTASAVEDGVEPPITIIEIPNEEAPTTTVTNPTESTLEGPTAPVGEQADPATDSVPTETDPTSDPGEEPVEIAVPSSGVDWLQFWLAVLIAAVVLLAVVEVRRRISAKLADRTGSQTAAGWIGGGRERIEARRAARRSDADPDTTQTGFPDRVRSAFAAIGVRVSAVARSLRGRRSIPTDDNSISSRRAASRAGLPDGPDGPVHSERLMEYEVVEYINDHGSIEEIDLGNFTDVEEAIETARACRSSFEPTETHPDAWWVVRERGGIRAIWIGEMGTPQERVIDLREVVQHPPAGRRLRSRLRR